MQFAKASVKTRRCMVDIKHRSLWKIQLGYLERSLKQFDTGVERLRSADLQTFGERIDDTQSVMSCEVYLECFAQGVFLDAFEDPSVEIVKWRTMFCWLWHAHHTVVFGILLCAAFAFASWILTESLDWKLAVMGKQEVGHCYTVRSVCVCKVRPFVEANKFNFEPLDEALFKELAISFVWRVHQLFGYVKVWQNLVAELAHDSSHTTVAEKIDGRRPLALLFYVFKRLAAYAGNVRFWFDRDKSFHFFLGGIGSW